MPAQGNRIVMINVAVNELEPSRRFYEEMLNVDFAEERHDDGAVHLNAMFGEWNTPSWFLMSLWPNPDRAGTADIGFFVDDLDQAYERAFAAGARATSPGHETSKVCRELPRSRIQAVTTSVSTRAERAPVCTAVPARHGSPLPRPPAALPARSLPLQVRRSPPHFGIPGPGSLSGRPCAPKSHGSPGWIRLPQRHSRPAPPRPQAPDGASETCAGSRTPVCLASANPGLIPLAYRACCQPRQSREKNPLGMGWRPEIPQSLMGGVAIPLSMRVSRRVRAHSRLLLVELGFELVAGDADSAVPTAEADGGICPDSIFR